jgi:type I restriction enzyme R subunit
MTDYNTIAETKNFIVLDRYQRDLVVKEDYQSEDALEREFIRDLRS